MNFSKYKQLKKEYDIFLIKKNNLIKLKYLSFRKKKSLGRIRKEGKVLRYRPLARKWEGTFEIVDPAGRMKKTELKDLIEYGGMFIGLGDDRKDNFGRFEVKEIKELKK